MSILFALGVLSLGHAAVAAGSRQSLRFVLSCLGSVIIFFLEIFVLSLSRLCRYICLAFVFAFSFVLSLSCLVLCSTASATYNLKKRQTDRYQVSDANVYHTDTK